MPVAERFSATQIERLSGLRDFPARDAARRELIRALAEVSRDEAHAVELVDSILRGREFCPTPADVYGLVEQAAVREFTGNKRDQCDVCHDTGWDSFTDQYGRSYSRRCACMATGARR